MSRLDAEFEQVLGSWLDHCAESLSLQAAATVPHSEQQDQDAIQKTTPSSQWIETAQVTADRFRGMIVDNMEKLREMFRVIVFRLKRIKLKPTEKKSQVEISDEDDDDENNDSAAKQEATRLWRQAQFMWMIFDTLLQTVPVVVAPWCCASKDFPALVEHNMPWEAACEWCGATVADWASVFRNADKHVSERISAIARQRNTSVMVAQNMKAERAARRREDNANAATRNASANEIRELQELTQRLVAALQKHKPSDGRVMNVKLEAMAAVKAEAAMQLQQAAAQLQHVGNARDAALDVDAEYEPTYVAGAQMHSFIKHEPTSALGGQDGDGTTQGGRREPRKRPR